MSANIGKSNTFLKYTENQLAQAPSDIRNNISSIRQAERNYNVLHSTLINKLKERTSENGKMGLQTILTKEEDIFVRWICTQGNFTQQNTFVQYREEIN